MFISRTPFRVSLIGGGTDLPCFYTQEPGAVISLTINKYLFITVNRRFDDTLRLSYSQTETVDRIDQVCHPLFREAMRFTGLTAGLEITSIADVPGGTGLGSSSSFTVGLLHALNAYQGCYKSAGELAEDACHLEIEVLGEPIGKQDQYAAAFCGLRRYDFNPDGGVFVTPVICANGNRQALLEHLLFFYLGGSRDARTVLADQCRHSQENREFLRRIRALVEDCWHILNGGSHLLDLGEAMHEAWLCKKRLAHSISNGRVDEIYDRARRAGALGGKVLGAGIGGFLMLFCDPRSKERVRQELCDLRCVEFGFEPEGSKIIYLC